MSEQTTEYWVNKLRLYFILHPSHWEEWKWRLNPCITSHDDKAPEWQWCNSCPNYEPGKCTEISNRLFANVYKNQIRVVGEGKFRPGGAFCIEWIKHV